MPCDCTAVVRDGAFAFSPELQDGQTLAVEFCPLHDAASELLEALKETREVAAALFRVISAMGLVDAVLAELPPGLAERTEGFGARAGDAIAKATGETR